MTNSLPSLNDIASGFAVLEGWEDRYAYLLDLAAKIPAYPEPYRRPDHLVKGCTSQVWLHHDWSDNGQLHLWADSDALLVRGLIAIVLAAYGNKTAPEILETDLAALFSNLGLEQNLSPNRRNGFYALVDKVRFIAAAKIAQSG